MTSYHVIPSAGAFFCRVSFWFLWTHVTTAALQSRDALQYDVTEQQPVGTIVGNVAITVRDSVNEQVTLHYSLSPDNNRYVHIETMTGIVRTAIVLDRELLCSTDFSTYCQLDPINVVVKSAASVSSISGFHHQMYKMIIRVVDINDHAPMFPSHNLTLDVREKTRPGTRFFVPAADDADSDLYGVKGYQLQPQSAKKLFRLQMRVQEDGSHEVSLVLLPKLDREVTKTHNAILVATDGGSPPRSGSMTITVNVLDLNDNQPRFQVSDDTYEAAIYENARPGTSIIQVLAVDTDDGANGAVVYRFAEDYDSLLYSSWIAIQANTGIVYVIKSLDREMTSVIRMTIIASDQGTNPLSSRAHLVINVLDLNDNAPTIQFTSEYGSFQGHVIENRVSGHWNIGRVTVSDLDLGDNGHVTCNVSFPFHLIAVDATDYQLVTAESATFDRELQSKHSVTIRCVDDGSPVMSSSHEIDVIVDDVNDNSPVLSRSHYEFKVNESSPMSTVIGSVECRDLDLGNNAAVTFQLTTTDNNSSSTLFAINETTGVISTLATLNHDHQQIFRLQVVVTDQGQPPRSSSASVKVLVENFNDERPSFLFENYEFKIAENKAVGTIIGQLKARDRDLDLINERIRYVIRSSEPRDAVNFIELESNSGILIVKQIFDYEYIEEMRLAVAVSSDDQLTVTDCNVTIRVTNENDNSPQFVFPSSTNRSVSLRAEDIHNGCIVARLSAFDRDGGQLSFEIVARDDAVSNSFTVDSTNGSISIVDYEPLTWQLDDYKLVQDSETGDFINRISLLVSVNDNDQSATEQLDINIVHTKASMSNLTRPVLADSTAIATFFDANSLFIVAGGSALGATFVLVLCLCVVCFTKLYCARTKMRRVYNCRRNEVNRTPPGVSKRYQTEADQPTTISRLKKGVTFDLGVDDFEECGRWRNQPRISSPLQHSRNYCLAGDCALHKFGSLRTTDLHRSERVMSVTQGNDAWMTISPSSYWGQSDHAHFTRPRTLSSPCSGLDVDLNIPQRTISLEGCSTKLPAANNRHWSISSLSDSGRGHSEGDDGVFLQNNLFDAPPPPRLMKKNPALESNV